MGLGLAMVAGCAAPQSMDEDLSTGTGGGCSAVTEEADDYFVGFQRSGSVVTVEFVDANPAPPARGDNRWEILVTDAASTPLEDLELEVVPFMVAHGHGTPVEVEVTPVDGAPGHYILDPVNMFMAGIWDVTMTFTLPDATQDETVFKFCVDP